MSTELELILQFHKAVRRRARRAAVKKLIHNWKKENFDYSPLHYAATHGDIELMELLIDAGMNINELTTNTRNSPLILAIYYKNTEAAKYLIRKGADPLFKTKLGNNAASIAIMENQDDILELLIPRGVNVNELVKNKSLLMLACEKGNQYVLNVLINAKTDVNFRGKDGYTALMVAAKNGYGDLVYYLLKADAEINAATRLKVGETPAQTTALMQAATFGQDNVIRILLNFSKKAEINAKNADGKTALHLAIENNRKLAIIALLKAGANLHIKDNANVSPLELMKKMMTPVDVKTIMEAAQVPTITPTVTKNVKAIGNKTIKTIAETTSVRNVLETNKKERDNRKESKGKKESQPEPELFKNKNEDPLQILQKKKISDIVKLNKLGWKFNQNSLSEIKEEWNKIVVKEAIQYSEEEIERIERWREIDRRIGRAAPESQYYQDTEYEKTSPLTWALEHAHLDTVKELIKAGFDVNEPDKNGETPLGVAAEKCDIATLQLLIEAGADINKPNNVQPFDTPLLKAIGKNSKNAIFLIKKGADIFKCFYYNYSALCAAIKANDVEVLKALHEAGLNLDITGILGQPSLKYAYRYGPPDAVKGLLQAGANINQVENSGESLYEHEPPTLKQKIKDLAADPHLGDQARQLMDELTVYDKMRDYVMRVGHGMGLSQKINISNPKIVQINGKTIVEPHVVAVRTEGAKAHSYFGAEYVHEKLNRFLQYKIRKNKFIISPWQKIYEAFNHLVTSAADKSRPLSIALFQRYQSKQLVIIPTGWSGHRVCLAIYKDKLFIINRGDKGDQNFGAKVYQIPKKNKSKITEFFINGLINNYYSSDFFENISTIVNLKHPLYLFPLKGQKHGTCDVANHKSSIEPLLAVLEHDLRGIPMEQAINKAQHEYKEFTHFIREDEINILIKNIQNKHNTKVDNDFYLEMVKAVLREHHSIPEPSHTLQPNKKVKNMEMDRALKLIAALPSHYLNALKKDPEMQTILQKCKEYEVNLKVKAIPSAPKPNLITTILPKDKKAIPVDEPLLVMQRNALRTIISRLDKFIKEIDAHPQKKRKNGVMFSPNHQTKKQIASELMNEFSPLIQEDKNDDLRKLFKGEETSEGLTLEDVQQFVKKEIEFDKKSSSVFSRKGELGAILKDINTVLLHKPELKTK